MSNKKKLKPLKKKKIKRRVRKGFLVAVFVLLLSAFSTLSLTVLFPINAVNVEYKSKLYTPEEIIEASDIEIGDNIILLSEKKVEEKLCKKLPYIGKVELKKKLDKIVIVPKNTSAKYCIKYKNKYLILDDNFKILEVIKKKNKHLTFLNGIYVSSGNLGEIAEFSNAEKFENIKSIYETVSKHGFSINEIDITSQANIEIIINSKFRVLFGTKENIDQKLAFLVKTINKIESKNKNDTGTINLKYYEEKSEAYFKSEEIKF